ncbi:hypothetical protein TrVE_jg9508 [Triparma verrucosa]|uniref:WW domain-containing protein n=1 Tax=Triparma verrucosa TaxID=1606542 RepID=A0A9W7BBE0_9STRA|nr:hypothetical protein TrVE_jg9508 [Triparma verrucosa]
MYFLLLRRERKLLDPGQRHFTFQLGSEKKGLEKALEERAKIEEKHPEVLRLAFLYRNYEPICYNFEPVCQWTEEWDAEFGAIYYLNIDGFTSTWDMPDDFWREEMR